MAVTDNDIRYHYVGGSGAGSTTRGDSSLGGAVDTANTISDTKHYLFKEVTSHQAEQGINDYRCIAVHNANADGDALTNPVVYFSNDQSGNPSEARMEFAIDPQPTAASLTTTRVVTSPTQSGNTQGIFGSVAPASVTGLTWNGSAPISYATGISLATSLPATHYKAIWLRRVIGTEAPQTDTVSVTLNVEGAAN